MRKAILISITLVVPGMAVLLFLPRGPADQAGALPLLPGMQAVPDSFTIRNDELDFKAVPINRMYWQERPGADWADLDVVVEMLEFIRNASILGQVEKNAAHLEPYGLDHPTAVVGIDTISIRLGVRSKVGDGVYGMVGHSSDVLLLEKGFGRFSHVGPEGLRDRIPIRFPMRELERIVVTTPDRELTLDRRESGSWNVEELSVRASFTSVWRMAAALSKCRIHRFDKGDARLEGKSVMAVELSWPGGTASIDIGEIVPATALRRAVTNHRAVPFLIPARVADSLVHHAGIIVDMALFSIDPVTADQVVVNAPGGEFSILRIEDDGWRIRKADGQEGSANQSAVRAFLKNLGRWEAVSVISPAVSKGIFTAEWEIGVDGQVVEIDGRVARAPLARRRGEEGVLLLGPGILNALPAGADEISAALPSSDG